MAHSVVMPELGESVTEGTITQWLKAVGDTVSVDEPLLEVSTDKVDTEVPSPVAGVLLEIRAEEDDTIEVGDVIAIIGDAGEAPATTPAAPAAPAEPEPAPAAAAPATPAVPAAPATSGAVDVVMPELGESVTEGVITQWLKSVGDTVAVDEALLEVSTDKVDTEVPSPIAGTIVEILFEEDDTVEVGDVIARIGDKNAAPAPAAPAPTPEPQPEPTPAPAAPAPAPAPTPAPATPAAPAAKVNAGKKLPYVTPLVRKLADKHGIDLTTVTGTGIGGRIRKQDVLAAAAAAQAPAAAEAPAAQAPAEPTGPRANWSTKSVDPAKAELIGTTKKVNRIREITAAKMVEALQLSAQLTHLQEVDMTRIAELRKQSKPQFQAKHGVNLTYLPFFVKAVVEALVSHPNVNASYNAETKEMTYHEDVNVAIAVDTPRGLLTPVIHKAQELTLPQIAQAIADLADRARNNKLKPTELFGATFTITNIGSEGALSDTPILVPPQAGILGTAAIQKRPVVVSVDGADAIAIRQMCYMPFTYDHQVVDGADAGRFTATIKDRLETGNFAADLDL